MKTNTTRAATHAWWVSSHPELDDLCPLQLILGQGRLAVGAPEPTRQQKAILAEPWNKRYARLLDVQTACGHEITDVASMTKNEAASVAQLTDEQIKGIARAHGTGGWQTLPDMIRFARAIIAQAAPPAAPVQGSLTVRVEKTAGGPNLYIGDTLVRYWIGCAFDGEAETLAEAIRHALAAPAAPASTCTRCDYIGKCDCEIGAAPATGEAGAEVIARQREMLERTWHVLKKHGVHPGRTDDALDVCVDRALKAATPPAAKSEAASQPGEMAAGVSVDVVTRGSAFAAISYMGLSNSPGREQEALDMLAAPPGASAQQEMGAGVPIDVTKVPGYVTPAQSSETAAAHAKLGVPQGPCDCSACVKMRGHLYGDQPAASAQQDEREAGEISKADALGGFDTYEAQVSRLRRALRPFADLATPPLSWAMVEHCIKDDPEKQTLQRPQMQRAFNRAAQVYAETATAAVARQVQADAQQAEREALSDADLKSLMKAAGFPFCEDDDTIYGVLSQYRELVESAVQQPSYQQLLDAITAAVVAPEGCSVAISVQKFCDVMGLSYRKALDAKADAQQDEREAGCRPYRAESVDGKQHDTGRVVNARGSFVATTADLDGAKMIASALNASPIGGYVKAIGDAGETYMQRFAPYAHQLPAQFRWSELWETMVRAAQVQADAVAAAAFERWLCSEMPAGTVIGDPKWWAPRILRAAMSREQSQEKGGERG